MPEVKKTVGVYERPAKRGITHAAVIAIAAALAAAAATAAILLL